MIRALVLAGGDGSRLLASGVTTPKALVRVAGVPQVVRMITACRRVGCDEVTCAVREDLVDDVRAAVIDPSVRIVPVRTPTSLHTLVAGLQAVAAGPVLCTLVDTVMPAADWDAMHATAAALLQRASAVVAVTPFVEDATPLWVDADEGGVVRAFGRRGVRDLVTGGVYWFDDRARAAAHDALQGGVQRLRGFLGRLVEQQLAVRTVEVRKIVDVDTSADLDAALALVGGEALS